MVALGRSVWRDFTDMAGAMVRAWWALVAPLLAGGIITAYDRAHSVPVDLSVLEVPLALALFVAFFVAWRRRQRVLESAQLDLRASQQQLAEARAVKRWQFNARVDWVQVFDQTDSATGEILVWGVVFVVLRNLGEDSLAENWRIHAKTKAGAALSVDIYGLGDSTFNVPFVNGKTVRYREEHCVNIRARNAVKRGDGVDGILACRFHGAANAGEVDAETLRVTFDDVNGGEWGTEGWVGVNTVTTPMYYNPGLPRAE